jgi:hypothetical protein
MSSVVISGDTSGSVTLSAPAIAGSNTIVLPSGSGTLTLPTATGTVALTSDVIGVSQTWSDVTASRASGTTYTNSTGKPIQVLVTMAQTLSGSGTTTIVVGGVTIVNSTYQSNATGGSQPISFSFIVPNSSTYTLTRTSGATIGVWAELR